MCTFIPIPIINNFPQNEQTIKEKITLIGILLTITLILFIIHKITKKKI